MDQLPLDLWFEIAKVAPWSYFLLAQTTKRMRRLKDAIMRHFTVYKENTDYWMINSAYELPNGTLHAISESIPSCIMFGAQLWHYNGRYHRVTGPAVIEADGTTEWYIHGRRLPRVDTPAF
jgi:hypothetical protein